MAQYINKLKVPSDGIVRHIIGFGVGDPGYDVLETFSKNNESSVSYYYMKNRMKCSVSVSELRGRYYVDHCVYSSPESFLCVQKSSCPLKNATRDYLMEAVMAYRAFRILSNKYISFRDDILDAVNSLECVYLGRLSRDRERLMDLLERSGFHIESVNFNVINTRENICLSFDGLCFHRDEIIP